MPHWYDPLLVFLADQPPETVSVTLTLDEVAVLVGAPFPRGAFTRGYWHARGPNAVGQRLRAAGWWVTKVQPRGTATTIIFMRYELTPWARTRDNRSR